MNTKHFELNKNFNLVGGNRQIDFNTEREEWFATLQQQYTLIDEELAEAQEGAEQLNLKEIRDGLADSLVVLDGLVFRCHLPTLAAEFNNEQEGRMFLGMLSFNYDKGRQVDSLYPLAKLVEVQRMTASARNDMKEVFEHLMAHKDTITEEIAAELLASIIINIYGEIYCASGVMGLNVMADQTSVYNSNMSKFDTDYTIAVATQASYKHRGLETEIVTVEVDGVPYYVNRSASDQELTGLDGKVKKFPKGKILKSINFFEPIWT